MGITSWEATYWRRTGWISAWSHRCGSPMDRPRELQPTLSRSPGPRSRARATRPRMPIRCPTCRCPAVRSLPRGRKCRRPIQGRMYRTCRMCRTRASKISRTRGTARTRRTAARPRRCPTARPSRTAPGQRGRDAGPALPAPGPAAPGSGSAGPTTSMAARVTAPFAALTKPRQSGRKPGRRPVQATVKPRPGRAKPQGPGGQARARGPGHRRRPRPRAGLSSCCPGSSPGR